MILFVLFLSITYTVLLVYIVQYVLLYKGKNLSFQDFLHTTTIDIMAKGIRDYIVRTRLIYRLKEGRNSNI